MKILITLFLLISLQSVFSQWEKTEWQSDPLIGGIRPFGDTLILVHRDGVEISLDKGKSWRKILGKSENLGTGTIILLHGNIFIGTTIHGVMFSSDLGKSWEFKNKELTSMQFLKLFCKGDKLYAATSGGGIFISTDLGENWVSKSNGLSSSRSKYVMTIAFNENRIFAGTAGGAYLSTDDGENWQFKNDGLPEAPYPSHFVFNKKGEIFLLLEDRSEGYHKFYISKDSGNTWTEKPNNINNGRFTIAYTTINDTIIISANNKLYYSIDMGDTWIKMTDIKDDEWELYSLASFGNVLYMCLGGDIFKSTDMGESWLDFKPKQYKYGMANSMAVINNKIIVASDRYFPYLNPPCIYTSNDLGNNWVSTCPNNIYDSPDYVWKTTLLTYKNKIFASTNVGFFVSTDYGIHWQEKSHINNFYLCSMAFSGDSIFAVEDWKGVYISPDMGETWEQKNTGLPEQSDIYSIKMFGDYLFVSVENAGIYRSSDRGESWHPINNGLPQNKTVSAFILVGNNLFAGITDAGVYISTNLGESWERRNKGLPEKPGVRCFYYIGNTIFIGIDNRWDIPGGIFISTDNGENWVSKSEGLRNKHFSGFADNGEYIFAATNWGGTGIDGDVIYRAKISDFGITDVKENESSPEINVYPNPTTEYIEISICCKELQSFEKYGILSIFDILGIEIISIPPGILLNGDKLKIDITDLPAGVYFIKSGKNEKKFIKI